jgi:hypothetical protein
MRRGEDLQGHAFQKARFSRSIAGPQRLLTTLHRRREEFCRDDIFGCTSEIQGTFAVEIPRIHVCPMTQQMRNRIDVLAVRGVHQRGTPLIVLLVYVRSMVN